MLRAKTILAAVIVGLLGTVLAALPRYELVELGLPEGTASEAVDVNDRDEVIGTVLIDGEEVGFLWREGNVTLLRGYETSAIPRDINNLGTIVGRSVSKGVNRAWKWENGIDHDLGRLFEGPSVAGAINDLGDVVGTASRFNTHLFLFSDPPIRLTSEAGEGTTDGGYDGGYSGPTFVNALNNNRYVLAVFRGHGTLFPILSGGGAWRVGGFALNASNHVAGYFTGRLGRRQPGVWTEGGWTALAAPLSGDASAEGINDAGVAVGKISPVWIMNYARDPDGSVIATNWVRSPDAAWLWMGTAGVALNGITTLPNGARLLGAVAVNRFGNITAHLEEGGNTRAVFLRRVEEGTIPDVVLLGITGEMHDSSDLELAIETTYPGSEVAFTLWQRRQANHSPHDYVILTHSEISALRTNVVQGINGPTTFREVAPGFYVVQAEVRGPGGTRLYSIPRELAVSGVTRLESPRVTWGQEFHFGLRAGLMGEFVVQESSDLREWRTLPGDPSAGGIVRAAATNGQRFYRALRARAAFNLTPRDFSMLHAPRTIGGNVLVLDSPADGRYELRFADDEDFAAQTDRAGFFRGTYRYEADEIHARLSLQVAPPFTRQYFTELEFQNEPTPTFWRDGLWLRASGIFRGRIGTRVDRPFSGQFSLYSTAPLNPGGGGDGGGVDGGGGGIDSGTHPAPASLSRIDVSNTQSGTGPSSYTIELSGGVSGAFQLTNGSVGNGTFTYSPNGNSARLDLIYEDFPGDSDNMILRFHSSSSGTHEGTQVVSGTTYPIQGTFTNVAQ